MKPVIALTMQNGEAGDRFELRRRYTAVLTAAGGIPVALPPSDSAPDAAWLADRFDGFLFTGGDDVNPTLYGETDGGLCKGINDERDRFESELLRCVLRTGKPVLGICRGIQLINAALGGTLIQHLDGHRGIFHVITLDSPLAELFGAERVEVNSWHHQAVKAIAPALSPAATADDGTVEALVMPGYPYLTAVQWHPEMSRDRNADILFSAFISACRKDDKCDG